MKYATQKDIIKALTAGGHIAIEWKGTKGPERRLILPNHTGMIPVRGRTVEAMIAAGKLEEMSRRKGKDWLCCYLGLSTTSCIGEMPNDSTD